MWQMQLLQGQQGILLGNLFPNWWTCRSLGISCQGSPCSFSHSLKISFEHLLYARNNVSVYELIIKGIILPHLRWNIMAQQNVFTNATESLQVDQHTTVYFLDNYHKSSPVIWGPREGVTSSDQFSDKGIKKSNVSKPTQSYLGSFLYTDIIIFQNFQHTLSLGNQQTH